jgi:hypothetical protein
LCSNPASVTGRVYHHLQLPDSDTRILLQRTNDEKASKERMHLDLETDDVETEVKRLETLGATRVGSPARTRLQLVGHA